MKNISLVISCGGAKGLVGIGVIEELERRGYNIKSVAGTSIGSVILGIYASGNLNEYKEWMLKQRRIDILRLMDFTLNKQGVIKGKKVFEEMKPFFKDSLIENLPIPYSAVAADIKSDWFNVTFASGIGIVPYFPLTYPNISLTIAKPYSKIHCLPIELI